MSKIRLNVKAVIFDMDGVITNTMPDHCRAWKTIFGQQGIQVSHLEIYSREGQPGTDSVMEIFRANQKPVTKKKAKQILRMKEQMFKKIVRRRFIAGARRFTRLLKRGNLKLALVTGNVKHFRFIKSLETIPQKTVFGQK